MIGRFETYTPRTVQIYAAVCLLDLTLRPVMCGLTICPLVWVCVWIGYTYVWPLISMWESFSPKGYEKTLTFHPEHSNTYIIYYLYNLPRAVLSSSIATSPPKNIGVPRIPLITPLATSLPVRYTATKTWTIVFPLPPKRYKLTHWKVF